MPQLVAGAYACGSIAGTASSAAFRARRRAAHRRAAHRAVARRPRPIQRAAEHVKTPASFASESYTCAEHIVLVRRAIMEKARLPPRPATACRQAGCRADARRCDGCAAPSRSTIGLASATAAHRCAVPRPADNSAGGSSLVAGTAHGRIATPPLKAPPAGRGRREALTFGANPFSFMAEASRATARWARSRLLDKKPRDPRRAGRPRRPSSTKPTSPAPAACRMPRRCSAPAS